MLHIQLTCFQILLFDTFLFSPFQKSRTNVILSSLIVFENRGFEFWIKNYSVRGYDFSLKTAFFSLKMGHMAYIKRDSFLVKNQNRVLYILEKSERIFLVGYLTKISRQPEVKVFKNKNRALN